MGNNSVQERKSVQINPQIRAATVHKKGTNQSSNMGSNNVQKGRSQMFKHYAKNAGTQGLPENLLQGLHSDQGHWRN
jgi:hypothetical protein